MKHLILQAKHSIEAWIFMSVITCAILIIGTFLLIPKFKQADFSNRPWYNLTRPFRLFKLKGKTLIGGILFYLVLLSFVIVIFVQPFSEGFSNWGGAIGSAITYLIFVVATWEND